jgi:hypothetical protein
VFGQLLENPTAKHPRELQDDSARRFPGQVDSSNLKLLKPWPLMTGDAVVLIGVASYSLLDLELLDRVNQSFSRWRDRFTIYTFDIATYNNFDDLKSFLFSGPFWLSCPDPRQWPPVQQTPIALVLKAHKAIEFTQGVGLCQRLLEDMGVL